MGRLLRGIKIGTHEDFQRCVNKENLFQMADNLYCDMNGTVYVLSNKEWVNYMAGRTNDIPNPTEEPIADFDVSENDFMSILFGKENAPRDTSRIRKFCNQLADIWESQCPDWRFCQLVSNVTRGEAAGKIPFYIEDDEMMGYMKEFFHLDDKRGEDDGSSKHQ